MMWYFLFFFVSGFCSILYELIWLRLAVAQFSATTAFVSIVLSMFMAGLGIGSVAAGAWVRRHGERIRFPPLRLYALTELLIGVSALVVPLELAWGHRILGAVAAHIFLSSAVSYLISGAWMALTLVPWCACMGATIPVAMFAIDPACSGSVAPCVEGMLPSADGGPATYIGTWCLPAIPGQGPTGCGM